MIRLCKTLNGLSWPRLLQRNEKYHWLQYNFEVECDDQSKEFGKSTKGYSLFVVVVVVAKFMFFLSIDLKETKNDAIAVRQDYVESSDCESIDEDDLAC